MSWREHPDLLQRPPAPAKCRGQLQGQLRRVLTADTAAIQSLTGAITPQPNRSDHYDGRHCLGHVLGRGKAGFEAFDADSRSLGNYPTQREAAAAIMGVR